MAAVVDAARSVGTYWDYQGNPSSDNDYFTASPGFGIHVGNHSYMIKTEVPTLIFPSREDVDDNDIVYVNDCQICREAFLFSLQNGVINVVARGNSEAVAVNGVVQDPTTVYNLFPQLVPDNWIISVGASTYDGTTIREGINVSPPGSTYFSLYGGNMDLIAPGSDSIVYTTLSSPSGVPNNPYSPFKGTSAAAPHVTGVVALLLSHYNKNCYSRKNLSVEDVEYILEHSATDVLDSGYDEQSAWGRLNAGAAIKMIENVSKQIVHPDSLVSSVVVSTDTIALRYNKALTENGWGPISRPFPLQRERNYQVKRVLVENTYSFAEYITPATQIVDIWARPSASNGVEYYEDTVRTIGAPLGGIDTFLIFSTFDLDPSVTIETIDYLAKTVKTRGYYYHFINQYIPMENEPSPDVLIINPDYPVNFWYPLNPINQLAKLPVSIYIIDSTLMNYYDYPCDSLNLLYDENLSSLSTNNLDDEFMKIYPNPFNNEITIQFKEAGNKDIMVHDLQGKVITSYATKNQLETITTKHYRSGIYFVTCENQSVRKTFKMIKL